MPEYTPANPVAKVAAKVIREHHPHLIDARVSFLFVYPAPKQNGRDLPGRVGKVADKVNAILEASGSDSRCDFVVEVASDVWLTADNLAREALVDDLMTRCWWKWDEVLMATTDKKTGEEKQELHRVFKSWTLRAPDVISFHEVLKRRGLWTEDLVDMAKHIDDIRARFADLKAPKKKAAQKAKTKAELKLVSAEA